jgi:hypothetical protein
VFQLRDCERAEAEVVVVGWDEGRMNATSTIDVVDVEFKLRSHAHELRSILTYVSTIKNVKYL